jgi:hypothetical protein
MLVSKKNSTCLWFDFAQNSTSMWFNFAQNLLSGCGCHKLRETIIDIFWSYHLQVIEKDREKYKKKSLKLSAVCNIAPQCSKCNKVAPKLPKCIKNVTCVFIFL